MEYFNLHTHSYSASKTVLELVNQYPSEFTNTIPYYSIGIHPWHINENVIASELEIIESKLSNPECLAIGECGLDKRIAIDFELQMAVFEKQLLLAEKYKKPLVIHCVGAFQELISLKNKLKISIPIIIHGYSKNEILAKQLIENNFYLSFGKYLLLNPDLGNVIKNIPLDRLFLETDTIDASIVTVYEKAAFAIGITEQVLKNQIVENFKKVFI